MEMNSQEYFTLISENLWFLRPEWFWGFVPIGVLAVLFIFNLRRKARWKKSFSRKLLPFLTIKGTTRQFLLPKLLLLLMLSLMLLGLAGPTWEMIERPGNRTEAALVILLDMSRSMLADDIQPNRIERAKLKIKDLFDARQC